MGCDSLVLLMKGRGRKGMQGEDRRGEDGGEEARCHCILLEGIGGFLVNVIYITRYLSLEVLLPVHHHLFFIHE